MDNKKLVLAVSVPAVLMSALSGHWLIAGLITAGAGVVIFRDKIFNKLETEKSGQTQKIPRIINEIVHELEDTLEKEGLIGPVDKDGKKIYGLNTKAERLFLDEVLSVLDSDGTPTEKRARLVELYHNWRENPRIKEMFLKVDEVIDRFAPELREKEFEKVPYPIWLAHYNIKRADNALDAIRKLARSLIKDGVSRARSLIEVEMKYLEQDTDEDLIKERLEDIRQEIEKNLQYGKQS